MSDKLNIEDFRRREKLKVAIIRAIEREAKSDAEITETDVLKALTQLVARRVDKL